MSVAGAITLSALVFRCTPFGSAAAPGDAGVRGTAAEAGSFCSRQDASFCADFDEDTDAAAGWSAYVISQSGVIGETASAVSPPYAFSSRVDVNGGEARLHWKYSPNAHHTALAFEVLVEPGSDAVAIAELDCANNDGDGGLTDFSGVWFWTDTSSAPDASPSPLITTPSNRYPLEAGLPSGWFHVEIVVDWGQSTSDVGVKLQGTTIFHESLPVACATRTDAFLSLGADDTRGSAEVLYDNVVLEVSQ
jgi:hypothetical protein